LVGCGSEAGRVRIGKETIDKKRIGNFIRKSIESSGKVIIQEKVNGKEFSANYIVDTNGHIFRMGENICYKRRNNNNIGPMCDGTGSMCINNTLPFLTTNDISYIEGQIIRPFCEHVSVKTRNKLCTLLNLDLIKCKNRIVLLEINCREAGGHSMANILPGIKNNLFEILKLASEGKLDTIESHFKKRASIVVSAFPNYFPQGIDEQHMQIITVSKKISDQVNLFTGWVDLIKETDYTRILKLHNSPSLLFEASAETPKQAYELAYSEIDRIVKGRLDYRKDIGGDLFE